MPAPPNPNPTPEEVYAALTNLVVEVQGDIPAISHKCLTPNGVETIVQRLREAGFIPQPPKPEL